MFPSRAVAIITSEEVLCEHDWNLSKRIHPADIFTWPVQMDAGLKNNGCWKEEFSGSSQAGCLMAPPKGR
jgi:hypothetical protein